jgi:hypothetical protein
MLLMDNESILHKYSHKNPLQGVTQTNKNDNSQPEDEELKRLKKAIR